MSIQPVTVPRPPPATHVHFFYAYSRLSKSTLFDSRLQAEIFGFIYAKLREISNKNAENRKLLSIYVEKEA